MSTPGLKKGAHGGNMVSPVLNAHVRAELEAPVG